MAVVDQNYRQPSVDEAHDLFEEYVGTRSQGTEGRAPQISDDPLKALFCTIVHLLDECMEKRYDEPPGSGSERSEEGMC